MLLIYNNKKRKAILNEYCGVRIINSRFTKEKRKQGVLPLFFGDEVDPVCFVIAGREMLLSESGYFQRDFFRGFIIRIYFNSVKAVV